MSVSITTTKVDSPFQLIVQLPKTNYLIDTQRVLEGIIFIAIQTQKLFAKNIFSVQSFQIFHIFANEIAMRNAIDSKCMGQLFYKVLTIVLQFQQRQRQMKLTYYWTTNTPSDFPWIKFVANVTGKMKSKISSFRVSGPFIQTLKFMTWRHTYKFKWPEAHENCMQMNFLLINFY